MFLSLRPTLRILTACAVTALVVPASAQSFHHAPPDDAPLLPAINPARLLTPLQRKASGGLWARRPGQASRPVSEQPTASAIASAPAPPMPTAHTAAPMTLLPDPDAKPISLATPAVTRWVRMEESGRPSRPAGSAAVVASNPAAAAPAARPRPVLPPAPAVAAATRPSNPPATRPATAVAARTLAARRLADGDVAEAEKVLVEATGRFSDDAALAVALARLRESREDWTGAAEGYSAAVRLRPNESCWKVRRAECLYHAGEFEAAVAEYDAAAVDPDTLSLGEYARFGDAALRTGDPAKAEAAFTAVSRTAEAPIARVELLRGMAALKQGEAARARDILLRANARWPHDPALTDALRLAAAMHYGDSKVMTADAGDEPVAPVVTTSAEKSAEEPLPTSGWRPAATESTGWRPTSRIASADRPLDGEPALLP